MDDMDEELLEKENQRMRAMIKAAERERIAGCKTYTLEESKRRVEEIYRAEATN